jgi:hypothetical protein
MPLYIGLDVSFDNMLDFKEILGKVGEVNSTKTYTSIRNYDISVDLSMDVTLVFFRDT